MYFEQKTINLVTVPSLAKGISNSTLSTHVAFSEQKEKLKQVGSRLRSSGHTIVHRGIIASNFRHGQRVKRAADDVAWNRSRRGSKRNLSARFAGFLKFVMKFHVGGNVIKKEASSPAFPSLPFPEGPSCVSYKFNASPTPKRTSAPKN